MTLGLSPAPRPRRLLRFTISATALLAATSAGTAALADAPNVVTTIKPVHSIASAVMEGVGTPHILIDGAASPHGFALKPSQAFLLQGADAVFWIGPELTTSLEKPISSMAAGATVVELLDVEGIEHLALREGAGFDAHDHGDGHGHGEAAGHDHHKEEKSAGHDDHDRDHDHEKTADHDDHGHDHDDHDKTADHDDHDHEKHASHDHDDEHEKEQAHADDHDHDHAKEEKHAEAAHDHDDHDDHGEEHAGHDHGHGEGRDAHIWLNPENGIAIAGVMATTLSELDPENADTYKANAEKYVERIHELEETLSANLKAVHDAKFVVFHDAYHHFEHHFDVEASGAISINPEALASAERLAEIQGRIRDQGITCVFQEPQFDSKLVAVAIEGSDAKVGTLDPLGTELDNGPDLYPELLSSISASIVDCLSESS